MRLELTASTDSIGFVNVDSFFNVDLDINFKRPELLIVSVMYHCLFYKGHTMGIVLRKGYALSSFPPKLANSSIRLFYKTCCTGVLLELSPVFVALWFFIYKHNVLVNR